MINVEPIKERLKVCTPYPWIDDKGYRVHSPAGGTVADIKSRWGGDDIAYDSDDVALIANAPTDLESLVSEVESLRSILNSFTAVDYWTFNKEKQVFSCELCGGSLPAEHKGIDQTKCHTVGCPVLRAKQYFND